MIQEFAAAVVGAGLQQANKSLGASIKSLGASN